MKLLFYTSILRVGGAERVMVNLANRFAEDNYEVVLVSSFTNRSEFPDYDVDPRIHQVVLADKYIASYLRRNYILTLKLRKLIVQEKPDVAVAFLPEPNIRLLLAAGKEMRKVVSVRNVPSREYAGWLLQWMLRHLFRRADAIVMQTQEALMELPVHLRAQSRVIMNQVNPRFYKVKRRPKGHYVALGRLSPAKNYPLLIKAFAAFAQKHPAAELRIYGNGPLELELTQLIGQLKAQKHIRLMGRSNDVATVLTEAKGYILSSDYEGMPNALLESMAAGLPCISTDCPCGGPKAVVENGVDGILIPVGDEAALTAALEWMETHPEESEQMGRKARKKAEEQLAPDTIYEAWKECLLKPLK